MITIRQPYPEEVEAVRSLFDDEVRAGRMLPRSPEAIRAGLEDWLIADDGGQIAGCVSLVYFNHALAEIRSLAVRPDYRGQRIGILLIESALRMAQENSVQRVLALTRAAHLFERAGFRRDVVGNFPEKVWRDCAPCPFRHACDEVALVFELSAVGEWVR